MIGALAPVGAVPSAHAEPAPRPFSAASAKDIRDCPDRRICVWTGENFAGIIQIYTETAAGNCTITALNYRSAYNRTGRSQRLWAFGCRGTNRTIANGSAIPAVGPYRSIGG
ncbi:peptidase inhibitor family I36 protein [Actinomadura rudentiformis]